MLNSENYSKSRVLIFLALVMLILWRVQLIQLYNKYIVSAVLSTITTGPVNDLVFGLISLAIILYFSAKGKTGYRLSLLQQVMLGLPGLFYLAARWYNGKNQLAAWRFTTFSITGKTHYADILLLLLAGCVVLTIYNTWFRSGLAANASYLQEDNPIEALSEDKLRREPAAGRVAQQIKALVTKSSFAIGIIGKWGEGKSSFIKLIELSLTDQNTIIIHFNPWLVESTSAIRKDFFETLKEHVGRYSGALATEISTYADGLASVYDSTPTKALKEAASFFLDKPTLTEQFEKVNETIASIDKKIVIFIDDIDRLDKDEVLETLRIVRNSASFNNTIFVLAYDKQYVVNAIKISNQANSSQYLDKIVQLEIPLPNFSSIVLATRTLDIIKRSVDVQYHAALEVLIAGKATSKPVRSILEQYLSNMNSGSNNLSYYQEFITTMRSATRFANLFIFDFLPLAGEVRMDEMLNLTLIKFRYPALYEAIKIKQVVEADYDFMTSANGSVIKVVQTELDSFYTHNEAEAVNKDLVNKVMKHLFGSDKISPGERTIQRPSSFAMYFSAGSFDNVSLAKIETLRVGRRVDIAQQLVNWQANDQLDEAFEIFTHIQEFNDRNDFENVVTAVMQAGKLLDKSILTWMLELNLKSQTVIANLYSGDTLAFKTFFLQLFASADAPYLFEAGLAEGIKAELWRNRSYQFFLTKDELDQITLGYLQAYIATNQVIDDEMFDLHFYNATDVDTRNYIIINPGANEPFKQAILANPNSALDRLVIPTNQPPIGQHLVFRPFLDQVFGSWQGFEDFIDNLPVSAAVQRVRTDYNSYKAAGYQSFER